METLKLSDIIRLSDESKTGIDISIIYQYKRSLLTYYTNYYSCEPVLIVTDVFNAVQYGFIAPSNEIDEAINTYFEDSADTDEEILEYKETVLFNSIMLALL